MENKTNIQIISKVKFNIEIDLVFER